MHKIADLAAAMGAEAVGDTARLVAGLAEPATAGPDDLALATRPAYAEGLAQGRARAALLWPGADWQALGLAAAIFAPRGRLAMATITAAFDPGPGIAPGIHSSAVIDASATLGEGAAIAPFVVIGADARIGPRARIGAHVSIGAGATIGPDALIHPGVRIGPRVVIGARFIAQPGAAIGGDGFSFVTPEKSGIEEVRETLSQPTARGDQSYRRIHSLGAVRIGDDVEIGANSCIDRGTIRDTEVGDGSKIDNHVQIGHNCVIGRDCLLCGQVGVSGSVTIGDRVVLAGKVGVADNLTIGDDVIATAAAGIQSNVPAGRVVAGTPAVKLETHLASYKALRRLPRILARLSGAQKAVSKPAGTD